MKMGSTSLEIWEIQSKITTRYHYTPTRMVKIKKMYRVITGKDVGQMEFL